MSLVDSVLKLNIKDVIFTIVPTVFSTLLMILCVFSNVKESKKNRVITSMFAFSVPILYAVNGVILSEFKPFIIILVALIFLGTFTFTNSNLFPAQFEILKPYSIILSNLAVAHSFYIMKEAKPRAFLLAFVLGLAPLLFHIKNLIKNKYHFLNAVFIALSCGFSLSFALNLPALSIGSYMFPIGAFFAYIGGIIYLSWYFDSLAYRRFESSEKKFIILNFFLLISSNLFALGINV